MNGISLNILKRILQTLYKTSTFIFTYYRKTLFIVKIKMLSLESVLIVILYIYTTVFIDFI